MEFFMDAKPPRFLIMVTIAVFVFMGAAAFLIVQSKSIKNQVEVAQ